MKITDFIKGFQACGPQNSYPELSINHLEGYRRACDALGHSLDTVGERRYEFSHNGVVFGRMIKMRPELTSVEASRLCRSKSKTQKALRSAGVSVPESQAFSPVRGKQEALAYLTGLGFGQAVIKPSDGRAGYGITTDVPDADAFEQAWDYAREALSSVSTPILVEEKVVGVDVRAVVVGGRFVCAASRLPAYVVGDGVSTLAALIRSKNEQRLENPYLRRHLIKCRGSADQVLAVGEVYLLTERANIHQGGEAVDVTDRLSEAAKRTAEYAAKAIPGLGLAGVDMIMEDFAAEGTVIEINTSCNFCMHYCPVWGEARNPAEAVLKAMYNKHWMTQEQLAHHD